MFITCEEGVNLMHFFHILIKRRVLFPHGLTDFSLICKRLDTCHRQSCSLLRNEDISCELSEKTFFQISSHKHDNQIFSFSNVQLRCELLVAACLHTILNKLRKGNPSESGYEQLNNVSSILRQLSWCHGKYCIEIPAS